MNPDLPISCSQGVLGYTPIIVKILSSHPDDVEVHLGDVIVHPDLNFHTPT